MSLVRRCTNDSRKSPIVKGYSNIFTPYTYRYLEEEIRKDKRITNLEQIDHQTYRVNDGCHSLVLEAHIYPCQLMKQMRLLCRHILKLRSYLCLPLFGAELVNERWTVEYYKTMFHTRFPPPQANKKCTNLNVALSEVPPEKKTATLTQELKYHNLKKTNKSVNVH